MHLTGRAFAFEESIIRRRLAFLRYLLISTLVWRGLLNVDQQQRRFETHSFLSSLLFVNSFSIGVFLRIMFLITKIYIGFYYSVRNLVKYVSYVDLWTSTWRVWIKIIAQVARSQFLCIRTSNNNTLNANAWMFRNRIREDDGTNPCGFTIPSSITNCANLK